MVMRLVLTELLVKPKLKKVSFIKRYTNYILLDFIGHFFDPLDSNFNLGQKLGHKLLPQETSKNNFELVII